MQRLEAGGGDALAFTGGDGSLLEQRAAHLLEKERIAAAALVDATRQFVRDALYAENVSHDRSGGFEVERHELNARGVRRPVDPPHPFGPGGDHDQQSVRGHDLEQSAQGFGGPFIRPVPVLQQQYTRRVPGECNQHGGERLGHRRAQLLAAHMARQRIGLALNRQQIQIERRELLQGGVDLPDAPDDFKRIDVAGF